MKNQTIDIGIAETQRLQRTFVCADSHQKVRAIEMLRRPEVRYAAVAGDTQVAPEVAEQIEIQAKYEGYIARQKNEIARRGEWEALALPRDVDYRQVRGLSAEAQQKLNQHKPETIGQASRMPGITPAAISLLLVHLKRGFQPSQKTA